VNKKYVSARPIIFVGLVLVTVGGIYFGNVNKSLNQSNKCVLQNKQCLFENPSTTLGIKFKHLPVIEEEMLIDFDISDENQINSAWIEGVNMYMGKMPVIFDNDKNVNGVTFLGSCSQTNMQWQLFIEVKNKAGQLTTYSALFSTHAQ